MKTPPQSNMDRWIGKVAIVTGASSGIGEAIAVALVEHGVKVVGLARRIDLMRKIAENLKAAKGTFYPVQCDLTKEEDILKAFKYAEQLGDVDILVNNAGLAYSESLMDGSTENYKTILDVNVLAAVICIREAMRSMKKRKAEGHIINMSSILGHPGNHTKAPLSLYQTSKHALTATSEVIRTELATARIPVKVTNLSPGLVKTEMPVIKERGPQIFQVFPYLESKDIAEAVLYLLGTPPNVQIKELTISALFENVFMNLKTLESTE